MGKSPNPTEDGTACKCLNCEAIITSEAVKGFTKNTWGSVCCWFFFTGPLALCIAYAFYREECHKCPSCPRECIHNF